MCVTLAASLLAGCGDKKEEAVDTTAVAETTEVKEEVKTEEVAPAAEAIPDPVYYFSFDKADDSSDIQPTAQDKTATPILQPVEKDKTYIPGVKGDSLYVDGVTGYKLANVNGVGDTYTVSFWCYATRFANYMPSIQFGPDVHGDVTGGQHYLNITRAEWAGEPTFPCIWAYDQNDNALWPAWADAGTGEPMKQWINVALVVDPAKVSVDGTMLEADLYINGQKYESKDSDGNVIPVNVVNGCMSASEGFDFLVGVNYWDSVFKGAFDELYIFDKALTAGQILSLYEQGDATVAYEEPERVVEVVATEEAIDQLGSTDLTTPFWSDWTATYEIKDGETKEVKIKNYSDGINLWDNFVTVFVNEASESGVDPNSVAGADHKEWAVTRADLFSWAVDNDNDCEYTWSWGNWDTWRTKVMVEADVTVTINRSGETLTLDYSFVDINGTNNTAQAVIKTALTAADPCYFLFTNEASYVELLSVDDAIVVEKNAAAVDSLGSTECNMGFWTDWTEGIELANGTTKTVVLKNYSDGNNNWDNFVLGFANNKNEAHSNPNDVADHVEYAAVRADAYGWNENATFYFERNWEDWEAWLNMMKAADVTLVLNRKGSEITMDATFVGRDNYTYISKTVITSSTLGENDPLYFFLTGEACYIDIMSVK